MLPNKFRQIIQWNFHLARGWGSKMSPLKKPFKKKLIHFTQQILYR
jgi:hypothetical protein